MKAIVAALLSVFALAEAARAFDCAKAGSQAERLICSDLALRRADESLEMAFRTAMKEARDAQAKRALTEDQRRWLAARDELPQLEISAEKDASVRAKDQIEAMKDAISQRIRALWEVPNEKDVSQSRPSRFALGDFAGEALEGCRINLSFGQRTEYVCDTTRTYQNGARLCRSTYRYSRNAGASPHEYRTVADIVDGKVHIRAKLTVGSGASRPDLYDNSTSWEWVKDSADGLRVFQKREGPPVGLPEPKVGGNGSEWEDWIYYCLMEPSFPHPP